MQWKNLCTGCSCAGKIFLYFLSGMRIYYSMETEIFTREEKEIPSTVIGEILMDKIKDLDAVAYVRFASVYREFKDVNTFMNELKKMLDK